MSFVDYYLKNYNLPEISAASKKILDQLETELTDPKSDKADFGDCLKTIGPKLADITSRFYTYFHSINGFSLSTLGAAFKFVLSISTEVIQVVKDMNSCVVDDKMDAKAKHEARVKFGEDLVYFVWMTVEPLKNRLNWLPFKATLEKKIVRWLAGMGMEHTLDLLEAMETVKPASDNAQIALKVIPG